MEEGVGVYNASGKEGGRGSESHHARESIPRREVEVTPIRSWSAVS